MDRTECLNEPVAGDVLQLRQAFDRMKPGWYIILVIYGASAQLCRSEGFPLADAIMPESFYSTNVYNLCAFNWTGLRIPMESLRERIER